MNKRFCLRLNLKNDPELIRQYEEQHQAVWPGVLQSIRNSGILDMEIYRFGTRLFMFMETEEDFSFERKQELDVGNATVAEWEDLMWKYQQPLEGAAPGEKWVLMDKLFDLKNANT